MLEEFHQDRLCINKERRHVIGKAIRQARVVAWRASGKRVSGAVSRVLDTRSPVPGALKAHPHSCWRLIN